MVAVSWRDDRRGRGGTGHGVAAVSRGTLIMS